MHWFDAFDNKYLEKIQRYIFKIVSKIENLHFKRVSFELVYIFHIVGYLDPDVIKLLILWFGIH